MIGDRDTFAQLQQAIERFFTEQLQPLDEQVDSEDSMPDKVVARMKAMGLFDLSIPEAYGGLGLTVEEEARIAMTLGVPPEYQSAPSIYDAIRAYS